MQCCSFGRHLYHFSLFSYHIHPKDPTRSHVWKQLQVLKHTLLNTNKKEDILVTAWLLEWLLTFTNAIFGICGLLSLLKDKRRKIHLCHLLCFSLETSCLLKGTQSTGLLYHVHSVRDTVRVMPSQWVLQWLEWNTLSVCLETMVFIYTEYPKSLWSYCSYSK